MKQSMIKNGTILAGFALVTTLLIGATFLMTQERIAEQIVAKRLAILDDIIDKQSYNNDIQHDCTEFTSKEALGRNSAQHVYRARMDGQPVAAAVETTAPNGYSGSIDLIVGIKYDGSISGVRVLQHKETPGLGDKIEIRVSDWITTFDGEQLTTTNQSSWQVKKDGGQFDQFTGATITPRAVVEAVRSTLQFYQQNRELIFEQATQCEDIETVSEQQEDNA